MPPVLRRTERRRPKVKAGRMGRRQRLRSLKRHTGKSHIKGGLDHNPLAPAHPVGLRRHPGRHSPTSRSAFADIAVGATHFGNSAGRPTEAAGRKPERLLVQ